MSKYNTGGWVDRRIPKPAMDLINQYGIGTAEFIRWFESSLGRYRASARNEPGVPGQVQDMQKLAKLMMQVFDGLEPGQIPPTGKAVADEIRYKESGEFFSSLVQRLKTDLQCASDLLERSADTLSAQVRRGPKNKVNLRNELLDALVKKIRETGITAADARAAAREILLRCGIVVPDSERAIRRATGSIEK